MIGLLPTPLAPHGSSVPFVPIEQGAPHDPLEDTPDRFTARVPSPRCPPAIPARRAHARASESTDRGLEVALSRTEKPAEEPLRNAGSAFSPTPRLHAGRTQPSHPPHRMDAPERAEAADRPHGGRARRAGRGSSSPQS
jgi:hypothetical protein